MKAMSTKTPQEDPEVKRLREAEQQRAEDDKIKAIQGQLRTETRLRRGEQSLFGLFSAARNVRSLLGAG